MTIPSAKVDSDDNKATTSNWGKTLNDLKEIVDAEQYGLYGLKIRPRKAFGSFPTAEVFMETNTASFLTKDPDGWFFKTYDWWCEHHGLGESSVRTGVSKLKRLGLI